MTWHARAVPRVRPHHVPHRSGQRARPARSASVEFVGSTTRSRADELADVVATKAAKLTGPLLGTNATATTAGSARGRRPRSSRRTAAPATATRAVQRQRRARARSALDDPALTAALLDATRRRALRALHDRRGRADRCSPGSRSTIDGDAEARAVRSTCCASCGDCSRELASELGAARGSRHAPIRGAASRDRRRTCRSARTTSRARATGCATACSSTAAPRADVELRGGRPIGAAPRRRRATQLARLEPLRIGKVVDPRQLPHRATSIIRGRAPAPRGRAADHRRARRGRAPAAQHRPVRRGQHRPARPRRRGSDGRQRGRARRGALRLPRARSTSRRGYSSYNGVFGTATSAISATCSASALASSPCNGTSGAEAPTGRSRATLHVPAVAASACRSSSATELTGLYRAAGHARGSACSRPRASTLALSRDAGSGRAPHRPGARDHVRPPLRLPRCAAATSTRCARSAPTWTSPGRGSTRTGSVGVTLEWEQRVDRRGNAVAARARGRVPARAQARRSRARTCSARTRSSRCRPPASKFFADRRQPRAARRPALRPGLPARRRGAAARGRAVLRRRRHHRARLRRRPARDRDRPGRRAAARQRCRRSACMPAGGNIRVLASLDAQRPDLQARSPTAVFTDAGMITNQWSTVTVDDIRPSVGMGLRAPHPVRHRRARVRGPAAAPARGRPGRWHISFAARAQF